MDSRGRWVTTAAGTNSSQQTYLFPQAVLLDAAGSDTMKDLSAFDALINNLMKHFRSIQAR